VKGWVLPLAKLTVGRIVHAHRMYDKELEIPFAAIVTFIDPREGTAQVKVFGFYGEDQTVTVSTGEMAVGPSDWIWCWPPIIS